MAWCMQYLIQKRMEVIMDRMGLTPNDKKINADQMYREGLITERERDEAIIRYTRKQLIK